MLLRYNEYVKEASEALYSHKLFIYLSVLLYLAHGCVFHSYYMINLFTFLNLGRWIILVSLAICLLFTTPRDPRLRVSTTENIIRRTTTLHMNLKDLRQNQKPEDLMIFVSKDSEAAGSVKSGGTAPRDKLRMTETLITVKVEKIKRNYDQY